MPADAGSCLIHLTWTANGFMDAYKYLQPATGRKLWVNRLNIYGSGESIVAANCATLYAGRHAMGVVGNMEGSWNRPRFQRRKGAFNLVAVAFQDHRSPQNLMCCQRQCGWWPRQPNDACLGTETTPASGTQTLGVLPQI